LWSCGVVKILHSVMLSNPRGEQ